MCRVTTLTMALLAFSAPSFAQTSDLVLTVDRPIVATSTVINGSVSAPLAGETVSISWVDSYGGVYFSTQVSVRGVGPSPFSFMGYAAASPVRFIEASARNRFASLPVTVPPRTDTAWDSFMIVADKPGESSIINALALGRLGITAAFASGYSDCLAAARVGLRPIATGLISAGSLSLLTDSVAAASSEYEASGDTAALVRSPALADTRETARLAMEASRQAARVRQLLPVCYVVADDASVTKADMPLDLSFAPADIDAFRAYLSDRIPPGELAAAGWSIRTPDFAELMPSTAREIKTAALHDPAAPVKFGPWAFHREACDDAFAEVIRRLSLATVTAARSPGDENFDYFSLLPVTAASGLFAPRAYGGFDWTKLPSSAHVFFMNSLSPLWAVSLVRDMSPDGKVIPTIDPSAAGADADLWRLVASGAGGVVLQSTNDYVKSASDAPRTGAPISSSELFADVSREVSGGLAHLMAATTSGASVALVYSPAAVRTGWMVEYLASSSPASNPAAGTAALKAWSSLLTDLGVDFQWASLDDITSEVNLFTRFQTVILPETWCMSLDAADSLGYFVRSGGTLIADNAAALADQYYAAYASSPLDPLFGVTRTSLTAATAAPLAPKRTCDLKTLVADPALVPAKGVSADTSYSAPTLVMKPTARGGAVYLNMFVEAYLDGDAAAKDAVKTAVQKALAAAAVDPEVAVYAGDTRLEAAVITRYHGRTQIFFIWPVAAPAAQIELRFPRSGDYYDLRPSAPEGRYLGNNATFFLDPPASGPFVIALEPFPLKDLYIDAEFSRNAVYFTARAEADLPPGDRPFRVEVYDASLVHLPWLDRTVISSAGTYMDSIDLPQNAQAGPWRILVRDLKSGMASWTDVSVP